MDRLYLAARLLSLQRQSVCNTYQNKAIKSGIHEAVYPSNCPQKGPAMTWPSSSTRTPESGRSVALPLADEALNASERIEATSVKG